MKKQISPKFVSLFFVVLTICFALAFYAVAWTEPTESPPGGNVPAPLNTGSTGQAKAGGLILNTGGAVNGLIVANGKVGIGTTGPQNKLQIVETSSGVETIPLLLTNRVTAIDTAVSIGFGAIGSDGVISKIQSIRKSSGNWHLSLWNADTGGIPQERMTIDKNGNVGIGTTSPSQKLDVSGQIHATGDICTDAGGGKCLSTGGGGGGGSGGEAGPYTYTAVLGLRNSNYCPVGWELNSFSSLRGSDGYLDIVQTQNMFFMGRPNSGESWQEYIRQQLHTNNQVNYICSKTFITNKKPYASVFMIGSTSADKCASGFTYVPASELKRNDGRGSFQAVEGNFYMGGLNNWWRDSQQQEYGAWQGREWHSIVNGICYKIFNVDGSASEASKGIFPVILTVQNADACPAGFESGSTADLAGTDGYMHIAINDNSATAGGVQGWWDANGENRLVLRAHKNWAPFMCWKFYETVGEPRMDYRLINSGNCPSGYTSIDASQLIGPNNAHAHIMSTPYGSYMGAIDWWDGHSFEGGFSRYWFDSNYGSKVCFKIDNVLP